LKPEIKLAQHNKLKLTNRVKAEEQRVQSCNRVEHDSVDPAGQEAGQGSDTAGRQDVCTSDPLILDAPVIA